MTCYLIKAKTEVKCSLFEVCIWPQSSHTEFQALTQTHHTFIQSFIHSATQHLLSVYSSARLMVGTRYPKMNIMVSTLRWVIGMSSLTTTTQRLGPVNGSLHKALRGHTKKVSCDMDQRIRKFFQLVKSEAGHLGRGNHLEKAWGMGILIIWGTEIISVLTRIICSHCCPFCTWLLSVHSLTELSSATQAFSLLPEGLKHSLLWALTSLSHTSKRALVLWEATHHVTAPDHLLRVTRISSRRGPSSILISSVRDREVHNHYAQV